MSGIVAVLDKCAGAETRAERAAVISAMLDRMSYRGPDGRGVFNHAAGGLGQLILETMPGELRALPPLQARGAPIWIVADVRLDNRDDLIDSLDVTPNLTDTELIVRAYERWGQGCAARLIGDFAFAILDERRHGIYCARDAPGVKTLYYHVDRRRFRCASDADTLFADDDVICRPNLESVARFIVHDFSECGDTLYEDVQALPPGHDLWVTPDSLQVRAFWRPDPWRRLPIRNEGDLDALFRETFEKAVRARLRSTTPVGMLVSGGVDSAAVAGQVESLRREGFGPLAKPTILHVGYPGESYDERTYCADVAKQWDLDTLEHRPLEQPDTTYPHGIAEHPARLYDPRWSVFPPLLTQMRDAGVRVILDGESPDLYFRRTGYEVADAVRGGHFDYLAALARRQPPGARLGHILNGLRPLIPRAVRLGSRRLRPKPPRDPVLTAHYDTRVRAWRDAWIARIEAIDAPDLATKLVCGEIQDSCTHHLFALTGMTSAAHRLETRHTWFDRRLIELAVAMPHNQRWAPTGAWKPKPLLRRAVRGLVPENVRQRRDAPELSCYVQTVLFDHHLAAVRNLFENSRLVATGVIQPDIADKMTPNGDINHLGHLSRAVTMEIWLRQLSPRG